MYGDYTDEQLQNSRFYIGRNPVPLRIDTQKDLAPYYPFLIAVAAYDKGSATVIFSEESFIDREEREHLGWKLRDLKKYWRKCKRNEVPYIPQEAATHISWPQDPHPEDLTLAERVGKFGEKATTDGVHDFIHYYYRSELFEEMIRLGWNKYTADMWIYNDFAGYKKRREDRGLRKETD
jgi:hypothetical protein